VKEKHILTLAIVLFALVCYYMIFEFVAPDAKPGPEALVPILLLDYDDVQKVAVKTSDGREFIAERQEGHWSLIKGQKGERWADNITDFVANLVRTVEVDRIPGGSSELSIYGLDNPTYQIIVTDVTDKTYQLLIGDTTPVKTSVYAKFAESPDVLIVGALVNWEISKIVPLLTSA